MASAAHSSSAAQVAATPPAPPPAEGKALVSPVDDALDELNARLEDLGYGSADGVGHCGSRASSLPRLIVCLLACRIPCLEADASEGITSATSPKTIYGLCATVADMVPFTVNNLWTVHCTLTHTTTPRQICALDTAARGLQPGKSPAHLVGFALNRGALQPQKEGHHVTHLTLINARSRLMCTKKWRDCCAAFGYNGTLRNRGCSLPPVTLTPCCYPSSPRLSSFGSSDTAIDVLATWVACGHCGTGEHPGTHQPKFIDEDGLCWHRASRGGRLTHESSTPQQPCDSSLNLGIELLAPREWNRTWLLQKYRRCVTCCR